jgi:ComF family protein
MGKVGNTITSENTWKKYFFCFADFFFPPQCVLCRKFLLADRAGYFCKDCFDSISLNNSPICPRCGMMFESKEGGDHFCSRCIGWSPFFDMARSVSVYEGMLRKAIHFFKYNNKSMLAAPLGKLLSVYGVRRLSIKEYELIMPVPLHPRRLRQRGFNQSLVLARKAARAWGKKVSAESLKRLRWTTPQTDLSEKQRRKNVKGAFSCREEAVRGKKILLIDDVYTSGSTVNECARVLKSQGALKVAVLTLARTR